MIVEDFTVFLRSIINHMTPVHLLALDGTLEKAIACVVLEKT